MVCSTNPRLASTGPPKWIGRSPPAAVASTPICSSRLSKVRLSISRLTTSPIAPSAEWAQRYTTLRAKRGSAICGIATSSWPASESFSAIELAPCAMPNI